ncbi:MAG: hypothetical protein IBJ03_04025 [Gemmatimonadaceae bacterium]|nr:hypothetical protein [Gemmatimonadaceae bacterium]
MPRSRNPRYTAESMQAHWCNYAWKPPVGRDAPERRSHLIASATAPLPSLICPTWSVDPQHDADASINIDLALTAVERPAIIAARDSLLTVLQDAVMQLPGDGWLRGQYVRFLVDQGFHAARYHEEALTVAQSCRHDPWWCGMLTGYAFARQERLAEAAVVFARARAAASGGIRCQQDNVIGLLDRRLLPHGYTLPISCAEHAAFARTLWWLADPFWSDALNERQIEHDVRTMRLLLSASVSISEHFDWTSTDPTDAVGQLVTRYGWPSKMFWSRIRQDRRLPGAPRSTPFEVGKDPVELAPSPPATTQEYTAGRVHVLPEWAALIAPLRAPASAWQLHAPPGGDPWTWWPFEHVQLSRSLFTVTDWQEQQWRRPNGVRLAIAARMPVHGTAGTARAGDSLVAHLLAARSPDTTASLDQRRISTMQSLVVAGTLLLDSAIVSLELRGHGALRVDARVRFGLTAEPPITALAPGQVAMAQPALLMPGAPLGLFSLDSIEARLLPSTTLRAGSVVGLYIESYGFVASDSVQYTVHVERLNRPGVFERISLALGGERGDASGVRIRWTDARPGEAMHPSGDAQSIHGRYLTLSTANLPAGDYALTVTMQANQGPEVSRNRLFRISAD